MKSFGIFAASALFGAIANAAPVNKRAVVWVTETEVDIVTVPVTKTVWAGAEETQNNRHPFWYSQASQASTTTTSASANVASTSANSSDSSVYVAPTPSSTSVYVAPTTSSTSVYVAPTTSSTSVYVAPTTSSTSVYVAPTTSSTSVYVAPTTSSTSVYVAPTTSSTSVYVAPTTSSVYVAPTTSSTSIYVAPTTTSVYVQPTTSTTSSAAAATTSSSSSGTTSGLAASGTEYTGDLTWYDVGLGACGWTNVDGDKIVAISHVIFDAYSTGNPNTNPLCGKYVTITGKDGSAYQAKVVDRCLGCAEGDLDLSHEFFNTVTSNGDGRVSGTSWSWN